MSTTPVPAILQRGDNIMSVLFTRRGPAPASPGTPASDLEIGSSVFLNVNGTLREFLIVHQGKPSSLYDDSCDGVWLLMKDVYENRALMNYTNVNNYTNSTIHRYLNGDFLTLLDESVQSAIKQVKIPYQTGAGNSGSVASGSSGLSAQIFLLSGYEVGWTQSTITYSPVDGACLSYFSGTEAIDSKRIGYLDGTAALWWLRSPRTNCSTSTWCVNTDGSHYSRDCSGSFGIRPALILPSNAKFDPGTREFVGVEGGNEDTNKLTITITTAESGHYEDKEYIVVDGVQYGSAGTVKVDPGTVITLQATIVSINGTNSMGPVTYTVNSNISVIMSAGTIQLTG